MRINDATAHRQGMMEHHEDGPTTAINMSRRERALALVGGAALALAGAARRGWLGLGLGVAGGSLLLRGVTGRSLVMRLLGMNHAVISPSARVTVPHGQGIRVEDSILIERSANELYTFWRDFTNLAQFLPSVKSVEVYEGNRSHWMVEGPAGAPIQWDAEIINDVPNELIAWRTVAGSAVDHAGTVRFRPMPDGGATSVEVVFEYVPTGGPVGAAVARVFGRSPEQEVPEALARLRDLFSCPKRPTSEQDAAVEDVVEIASEESFPASDPPATY